MAERVCNRCGANCMSSRTCQCGGSATKDYLHRLPDSRGHGTVIDPISHETLMCDTHKQFLVLTKRFTYLDNHPDYVLYRCTHTSCETRVRVIGDEL